MIIVITGLQISMAWQTKWQILRRSNIYAKFCKKYESINFFSIKICRQVQTCSIYFRFNHALKTGNLGNSLPNTVNTVKILPRANI